MKKMPDKETIDKLLLITRHGSADPYLDLAIGTKVSCTMNLGNTNRYTFILSPCMKYVLSKILVYSIH